MSLISGVGTDESTHDLAFVLEPQVKGLISLATCEYA